MRPKVYGFCFGPDDWGWMWGEQPPRHRRHGRRRHGGRRQWFESGEMRYVILKLLRERPMHGYEVMKALTEETDGWYKPSPGTVYPTLQWLEDEGLVEGRQENGKKVYAITDAGLEFLEENKPIVDDIFERVEETIDSLFGDPMPDITKLVGQLLGKTYRVAWTARDDSTKQAKLSDILNEAIQKIEALTETEGRRESSGGDGSPGATDPAG